MANFTRYIGCLSLIIVLIIIKRNNSYEVQWIDVPNIKDPRGNLAVLENSNIPFEIKRVFYLYDVPSGSQRGGHALKKRINY